MEMPALTDAKAITKYTKRCDKGLEVIVFALPTYAFSGWHAPGMPLHGSIRMTYRR